MEVNRPDTVVPTGQHGGQGGAGQRHREESEPKPEAQPPGDPEAFEVEGLAAEITPAAQAALDALVAEIEPLRYQLKLAGEREARLKEDIARHAFLGVPSRREFMRELGHVLAHVEQLTTAPSVVVMHVAGADAIRRRHGRGPYEGALKHVADAIRASVHPTDAFGSLGGHDFGLVLLVADPVLARERARQIAEALNGKPYAPAAGLPLDVIFGVAALTARLSPDAALAYADRDMVANFGK